MVSYRIYTDVGTNFFMSIFFQGHWQLTEQHQKGGVHLLFHSTTSTRSWTFRNLFATLHVRWLSHIFNLTTCIYQTASQWDSPPYGITIWQTDDVILIFVVYLMIWFQVFVTATWHGKLVDLNSHQLSLLYYQQIN